MTLSLNTGANSPGVLVTFEGGDGAGKSTHIRFLADVLDSLGFEVARVREPGGTVIGEQLRGLVLDPANADLSPRAELLIYEAARAQLVDQVIRPALQAGKVVLCDRFTDSTLAYQGYGRGLDLGFIREANAFATAGVVPDATIVLSCPDREEKKNRVDRREEADRLELAGDDFHSRVIDAFAELAEASEGRIRMVETSGRHSQTARAIFAALSGAMPWLSDGTVDLGEQLAAFDAAHDRSNREKQKEVTEGEGSRAILQDKKSMV